MTGRYRFPAEPFSAYTDGAFEDETPGYELETVPPSTYETEPEVWQNLSGWLNRAGDWFSGLAQPGTLTSPAVPASPAIPAASGAPVDRSSPAYIRWVQSALNRILGLNLAVDGKIGSQTKAAVRAFQTRQGLVADGKVGTATERALITAGAGNPPVSSTPATPTSSQINTPLPASGPGYYAYQTNQARRYGIPETIQALQAIGLM